MYQTLVLYKIIHCWRAECLGTDLIHLVDAGDASFWEASIYDLA